VFQSVPTILTTPSLSTRGPIPYPVHRRYKPSCPHTWGLCELARNPGRVSVRAFQIGEMSPIVVHVHAAWTRDVKEIASPPKNPPANGHREPYSRINYVDVRQIIHDIGFRDRNDAVSGESLAGGLCTRRRQSGSEGISRAEVKVTRGLPRRCEKRGQL
jgi:hypothetical protein